MIYVLIQAGKARLSSSQEGQALNWVNVQSRHDWKTFEQAKAVAALLTRDEGRLFIATDAGECVSPRYDVIEAPKVGDDVSYSFNGDSYPCGKIKSISKSLRLIVTDEGKRFYRRQESGQWMMNGTWCLVSGHISEQNPHV
jgi:hypothetical protein